MVRKTRGPGLLRATTMALVAGLLVLGGLIGVARAAAPEVDDEAGLFSEGARRRADQILADIYRETSPHKDVVVETHPELPRGLRPEQFSEERFRKRDVNGLLVLITKRPHKLLITVGRHTQDRFGASDAERMRGVMLERFKKSDFDGGLIEGLRYAERILKASYAPGRGVPAVEQRRVDPPSAPYREAPVHTRAAEKSGCSGASIFGVLLVVGLIWLIVGLIRGIWRAVSGGGSSPSAPSGGGYTGSYGGGYGGGYGASGGGGGFGWGKAIAGGLFGAVAGNWVYDRFFRDDHHSSSSDYVGTAYADTGSSSSSYQAPSDEGQVGTTVGGGGGDDWGGSSSSDYSSGGSDWGGGGDSGGGGDWGGGGDSGGGGGDW